MKKGFTLVELLAVIVVLAIVITITQTSINKVLGNAKKGTAEATAYAIIRASSMYSLDNNYYEPINVLDSRLSYDGEKPTSGTVQTNSNGDTKIAILFGDWCVIKTYSETEVSSSKTETCTLP